MEKNIDSKFPHYTGSFNGVLGETTLSTRKADGWKMLIKIKKGKNSMFQQVKEWQSPDFHNVAGQLFLRREKSLYLCLLWFYNTIILKNVLSVLKSKGGRIEH